MNYNYKVSILITSYNRLEDLKDTIIKTKKLFYNNFEIIIVDNGSSDGTKQFLNNINDKNINILLIKENKGPAYAHDYGMRACKGEFIITIDDDCFLQPNVISHTVEIFNNNKNLSAIGYGFMNPNILFTEEKFNKDYFNKNEIIDIDLNNSYEPIIATSGAAFRSSSLQSINYYDLNWFHVEDWELSLKLIANNFSTIKISSLTAFHKSSPINRDFEKRRYHQIQGSIWLMLKFYPLKYLIKEIFIFSIQTIYYSILYKKISYIFALISSFKKFKTILKKRIIIPKEKLIKMNKAHNSIFG